jgi:hypothetical protein
MIFASPRDGRLGPVHVLGFGWHNGIHLSLVPEVVPLVLLLGDEDVVLLDVGLIEIATSR